MMPTTSTPTTEPAPTLGGSNIWTALVHELRAGALSALEVDFLTKAGPTPLEAPGPEVTQALVTIRRRLRRESRFYQELADYARFCAAAEAWLARGPRDGVDALPGRIEALNVAVWATERACRAVGLLDAMGMP
jgi:hypothetical protein